MKYLRYAFILIAVPLALAACGSLPGGIVTDALVGSMGSSGSSDSSGSAVATSSAVADFQSGEILASWGDGKLLEADYYVAKVLKAASAETKNQAQVIYVSDGKKAWANFLIGSRKAAKSDLKVGTTVFYIAGWAQHDKIPAENYRKDRWLLGSITSTENLYKGQVEIDGDNYAIDYLRVPTDPVD
jgi:hypothetical protein